MDRQLNIEAKLDGTPADGYEVYGVSLSRNTVNVHGPSSNINALPKAPTETISVAGRRESFSVPNAAIDISDPKIDVLEPTVSVDVEIGERRVEREFADVAVTLQSGVDAEPNRASVVIYGPPNAFANVKSTDLKLVLPVDGDVTKATLDAPAEIKSKLSVRSVKPSKFKSTQVNQ
jgi:YbbR domain-containing protein